ncbi:MAG: hypothetical protein AAGA18_11300 [Verrucomicrobiota bacterium]
MIAGVAATKGGQALAKLGGKALGNVLEGASDVASGSAKQTAKETKQAVKALEVDGKGALDKKAVKGDNLEHHEIPSKAAIQKNVEN